MTPYYEKMIQTAGRPAVFLNGSNGTEFNGSKNGEGQVSINQLALCKHCKTMQGEVIKDISDYDYCLVFPTNENKDFTDYGKCCMENIQALGYETYIFKVEGKRKKTFYERYFGVKSSGATVANEDEVDEESAVDWGSEMIKNPKLSSPEDNTDYIDRKSGYFHSHRIITGKQSSIPQKNPSGEENENDQCIIFVLLRTPLHKLREFAERMELKMVIDPAKAKELLAEGDPEHKIKRVVLKHDSDVSPIGPYECLHARYRKAREFLYWKGDDYFHQNTEDGHGGGEDYLTTTDNISRYYSKNSLPVFENSLAYSNNIMTTPGEEQAQAEEEDEDQGQEHLPPVGRTVRAMSHHESNFRYSFGSGGSISTYSPPQHHQFTFKAGSGNSSQLRTHPFRDLLRIKISTYMLQSRPRIIKQNYVLTTMENLKIHKLLRKERLLGCFVLHNPMKTLFQTNWRHYPFQQQPIYEVKEYFGEKFAFFYAFLDHYTMSLFIPAIISIPFQCCVFWFNDYSGKN
jgi:hypothetical protein